MGNIWGEYRNQYIYREREREREINMGINIGINIGIDIGINIGINIGITVGDLMCGLPEFVPGKSDMKMNNIPKSCFSV